MCPASSARLAQGQVTRRTQSERSAETQNKILQATAYLLQTNGYAATSMQAIAKRAGVSLGAMQHHYPAKAQVMAAVLQLYVLKRAKAYRLALLHQATPAQKIEALLQTLWTLLWKEPEFVACIEIELARRSDKELATTTAPILARTDVFLNRWFSRQLTGIDKNKFIELRLLTNVMLRGIAVEAARGVEKASLEQTYATCCIFLREEFLKALKPIV